MPLDGDIKGWGLLIVERAIADQTRPALFERHKLPHHLIYAGLFHYPCYGKLGDHLFGRVKLRKIMRRKDGKSGKSGRPEDG